MINELGSYCNATELAKALGISRSGIFTLVRNGEFPKGIRLGHSRRWCLSEVKSWLDKKKEA